MTVADLEEAKRRYPPTWTVYDHPVDLPNWIVVRLAYGDFPTHKIQLCHTIEQARQYIESEGGEWSLGRLPEDDPKIIETWI